jgi:hypothetical protein
MRRQLRLRIGYGALGARLGDEGLMPTATLSHAAKAVFDQIGIGSPLFVPDDGSTPCLLGFANRIEREVPIETARELIDSGWLFRLTEFEDNNRCGWRLKNLPGDRGAVFTLRWPRFPRPTFI